MTFSTRSGKTRQCCSGRNFCLAWFLSCCAILFLMPAYAQSVSAAPEKTPEEDILAPASNALLKTPVTLLFDSRPVAECLQKLAEEAKIPLTVEPSISQRRISVFATRQPLHVLLRAMARVSGYTWRRNDVSPDKTTHQYTYLLYQTEASCDHEQALLRESQDYADRANALKKEALLAAIKQALKQRDANKPSLADFLGGLSEDQLSQIAETAAQPTGIISASDQSHFYNHLLYSTPYSSLSPANQASLRSLLGRPEYDAGASGASRFAGPYKQQSDLENSQIGFVAADGGVRLGIVPPDGKDLWVSPFDAVERRGIAGVDRSSDLEPELAAAFPHLRIDLAEMPDAIAKKRLQFLDPASRGALPDVLKSVALQLNIPIVSDDFLRSRVCFYSWLLTDKDHYTPKEALTQIAKAFTHNMAYEQGALCVTTVSLGFDLRAEPSPALVSHLRELTRKHLPVQMQDFLAMSLLSDLQLETLEESNLSGLEPSLGVWKVTRLHSVLQFYARLPEEDQATARSAEGLPKRDMTLRQKEAFTAFTNALLVVGMPGHYKSADAGEHPGLYVRSRNMANTEVLTFQFVSDSESPKRIAYTIEAP